MNAAGSDGSTSPGADDSHSVKHPTGLWTDLGQARLIARVEYRRSVRQAREDASTLIGLALSGLMVALATVVVAGLAVAFGDSFGTLDAAARSFLGAGAVALLFFATVMVAFRAVGDTGQIDAEPGILTATSPRSVVFGLLLAELYRVLSYLGVSVVAIAAALGVGASDPLVGLAALTVLAMVLATGLVAGFLIGTGVLYLSATVPLVRHNRLTLAAIAIAAYLGVVLMFGDLMLVLAGTPLAWIADPLLLAAGAGGDPLLATVALAGSLAFVTVVLAALPRLSAATWYADPAPPEESDGGASTLVAGVDELLAPLVARPTASVARKTLLRARRAPYTLTFAFVPAFASVGYLSQAIQTGELPGAFPVLTAAYAGWGVGSAFTLNPLGDEGALLPVTLSTGVAGERVVHGRVLAAWLAALPVALALVALTALAARVPVWKAVGSLAFALVFSAAAPLVAVGIGTAFPKFDTTTVMVSREAVVPSVFAFGLFTLVLVPLGAPAFLGLSFAELLAGLAGLPPAVVAALGVGLTTILSLAGAVPTYAYAVRRFEGYSIE